MPFYDAIKTDIGWVVIDTKTGQVAKFKDRFMEGMTLEDADDMADLLNHLAKESADATKN